MMSWFRIGAKPFHQSMLSKFGDHICITMGKWVHVSTFIISIPFIINFPWNAYQTSDQYKIPFSQCSYMSVETPYTLQPVAVKGTLQTQRLFLGLEYQVCIKFEYSCKHCYKSHTATETVRSQVTEILMQTVYLVHPILIHQIWGTCLSGTSKHGTYPKVNAKKTNPQGSL